MHSVLCQWAVVTASPTGQLEGNQTIASSTGRVANRELKTPAQHDKVAKPPWRFLPAPGRPAKATLSALAATWPGTSTPAWSGISCRQQATCQPQDSKWTSITWRDETLLSSKYTASAATWCGKAKEESMCVRAAR